METTWQEVMEMKNLVGGDLEDITLSGATGQPLTVNRGQIKSIAICGNMATIDLDWNATLVGGSWVAIETKQKTFVISDFTLRLATDLRGGKVIRVIATRRDSAGRVYAIIHPVGDTKLQQSVVKGG